jgi:hypothetical protein
VGLVGGALPDAMASSVTLLPRPQRHAPRRGRSRAASRVLPALGALVLALHQLASPFLLGCRCEDHDLGTCPHARRAAEPSTSAEGAPEGASCHVKPGATTEPTREHEGAPNPGIESATAEGAHCPAGPAVSSCDGSRARGLSAVHTSVERGALPANLVESPRVGTVELAVKLRAGPPSAHERFLDPPPTPPPWAAGTPTPA